MHIHNLGQAFQVSIIVTCDLLVMTFHLSKDYNPHSMTIIHSNLL